MDEKHVDILDRIEIKLASNINLNFPNFIIHRCDILRNINIRCAIDKIYIWVIYRTPKLIIQYIYICFPNSGAGNVLYNLWQQANLLILLPKSQNILYR